MPKTLASIHDDVYAVHKWRPVTPNDFLEQLAQQAMTLDEPTELKARADTLDDGRTRISYLGYVRPVNFEGEGDDIAPYLLMIYEPETGKKVFMRRTDVTMNHM